MTLIFLKRLTDNYSAIFSDCLVTGDISTEKNAPFLPSDTKRPEFYKSRDLNFIFPTLKSKTIVPHPNLTISAAGSAFVFDNLIENIRSEDFINNEKLNVSQAINFISDYIDVNSLDIISVILKKTGMEIIHSKNVTKITDSNGYDLYIAGSGSEYAVQLARRKNFEFFENTNPTEWEVAITRGIQLAASIENDDLFSVENTLNGFGGSIEILFIDHIKNFLFSIQEVWHDTFTVYPRSYNIRDLYSGGDFFRYRYNSSGTYFIDTYNRYHKSERGYRCKIRLNKCEKKIIDVRRIEKIENLWISTYNICTPSGNVDYHHQVLHFPRKGRTPWRKIRKKPDYIEFLFKGTGAFSYEDPFLSDDKIFNRYHAKLTRFPNEYYKEKNIEYRKHIRDGWKTNR